MMTQSTTRNNLKTITSVFLSLDHIVGIKFFKLKKKYK